MFLYRFWNRKDATLTPYKSKMNILARGSTTDGNILLCCGLSHIIERGLVEF